MADNVFGKPITEGDRKTRALKALIAPNADKKRDQARAYVKKKKEESGSSVATLSIFYNATGETLIYNHDNSLHGHIYDSYPTRVQNGQWGAFLHVKRHAAVTGSVGFVVYRVKINDTDYCDELFGWKNPVENFRNIAYCDIFDDGKVDPADEVYKKMEAKKGITEKHIATKKGNITIAVIEEGTSPMYEVELAHEEVFAGLKATQNA